MLSLGKIDHIHIRVTDLAKAQGWYQRVLNLAPDTRYKHMQSGPHGVVMLMNSNGSVRLAISQEDKPVCEPGSVAFLVSGQDFLEWIDQLAGERVIDRAGQTVARDSVWITSFSVPSALSTRLATRSRLSATTIPGWQASSSWPANRPDRLSAAALPINPLRRVFSCCCSGKCRQIKKVRQVMVSSINDPKSAAISMAWVNCCNACRSLPTTGMVYWCRSVNVIVLK
jgi:catechol 2,3-dioxygenase-like lactoylglutathione lyase family enzyme